MARASPASRSGSQLDPDVAEALHAIVREAQLVPRALTDELAA
jgi:hypothetical protein